MAINTIPAGSYNSPSVQTQAPVDRAEERRATAAKNEEQAKPPTPNAPTVNTSGQTVGTLINVQA